MDSDSEERELERLVFGDDIEFQRGISKLAGSAGTKTINFDVESEDDGNEGEAITGLETLEDADVRFKCSRLVFAVVLTGPNRSSWLIPWVLQRLRQSLMDLSAQRRKIHTEHRMLLLGMIATMKDYLSH
jgi:hypothetical protein